eukprot:g14645.t1
MLSVLCALGVSPSGPEDGSHVRGHGRQHGARPAAAGGQGRPARHGQGLDTESLKSIGLTLGEIGRIRTWLSAHPPATYLWLSVHPPATRI